MHWAEPYCKIIQAQHINECQDDAFRLRRRRRRNRHEKEVDQDQSCQSLSWIHLLVECWQAVESLLHYQGHVRAVLWDWSHSHSWSKGWSFLGPSWAFAHWKRVLDHQGSYLHVRQFSWVAHHWRGWPLWRACCQFGAHWLNWPDKSLWRNGRWSLVRARRASWKTLLFQSHDRRGQNTAQLRICICWVFSQS